MKSKYNVICYRCGRVSLTYEEYIEQLCNANLLWRCPNCGMDAEFDDETYEEWGDQIVMERLGDA